SPAQCPHGDREWRDQRTLHCGPCHKCRPCRRKLCRAQKPDPWSLRIRLRHECHMPGRCPCSRDRSRILLVHSYLTGEFASLFLLNWCLVLNKRIIRITIQPAFAWLGRGDYWMFGSVRVLGGVHIWGTVATQSRITLLTGA